MSLILTDVPRLRSNVRKTIIIARFHMYDKNLAASLTSFRCFLQTEDEALARALALSMQDNQSLRDRDTAYARALYRQRVGGEQSSRCTVT